MHVVACFALGHVDALAGQTEPDERCGEGADGGDAVQVVDWDAVFGDVVVVGACLCEFEDSPADGGV